MSKKIKKLQKSSETIIQRTVSDFSKRAPAWVSQGIREKYGVDKEAISDAFQQVRRGETGGDIIENVELVYRGSPLTLTHFKMTPKAQPSVRVKRPGRIPGQAIGSGSPVAMVRAPKAYKVKAMIFKGKRTAISADTFVAPVRGGNVFPFQRASSENLPVEAVRTLSVPQMIDGRAREDIGKIINDKLGARIEHHIQQALK